MALFGRGEAKPSTRTDTPDHTDRSGRSWTGSDYDEARASGRPVFAPRTTHSNNRLGQSS